MKQIIMLSTISLCVFAMTCLSSDVSSASALACTGNAKLHADWECVDSTGCTIKNECPRTVRWQISDTITTTGNHTITVTGLRPSGGTLACIACATTFAGVSAGCTGEVSPTAVNVHTRFTLGTVNVPNTGSIVVGCDISPGAVFDTVTF